MKLQIVEHYPAFIGEMEEQGFTIVDTMVFDSEPIFSEDGDEELVTVTEYHFQDENGGYAGVLQVTKGEDWTEANFLSFTVTE